MAGNASIRVELIDVAISAARKAGDVLKNKFRKNLCIAYKDEHNIVTDADGAAEEIILQTLQNTFPRHSYFSEETGFIAGDTDFLWVIDPLDGTTNFSKGISHFCTSIGFYYRQKPCVAVVYNPIQKEMFCAEAGSGAYLNDKKISVSSLSCLNRAVIVLNRGATKEEKMRAGNLFPILVPRVQSIRILGATAIDLCYLACGRIDAMVNGGCEHYDCAAGNLIAMEAGAIITDFSGVPWTLRRTDILAANPLIHAQLLSSVFTPN